MDEEYVSLAFEAGLDVDEALEEPEMKGENENKRRNEPQREYL